MGAAASGSLQGSRKENSLSQPLTQPPIGMILEIESLANGTGSSSMASGGDSEVEAERIARCERILEGFAQEFAVKRSRAPKEATTETTIVTGSFMTTTRTRGHCIYGRDGKEQCFCAQYATCSSIDDDNEVEKEKSVCDTCGHGPCWHVRRFARAS